MKRNLIFKLLTLMLILSPTNTISPIFKGTCGLGEVVKITPPKPLYTNVWGTIYHAEKGQCDNSPTITGDGSKINPSKASNLRWIAISQEMLKCKYRENLYNDENSPLYKGKINYGDTVWVESSNPNINGMWIVHDSKNKRYRKSIDFLQTKGDGSLYNNNPLWNGKFNNIKLYLYRDKQTILN